MWPTCLHPWSSHHTGKITGFEFSAPHLRFRSRSSRDPRPHKKGKKADLSWINTKDTQKFGNSYMKRLCRKDKKEVLNLAQKILHHA